MNAETFVGPLVDEKQFERVMGFIEQGKKEATLITGGERSCSDGLFIQPTLFLDPQAHANIYRE